MEKTCTQCGLLKALDAYPPQRKGKFGRMAWCRACVSARRRARYAANPGRERARNAAWSRKNWERHSALTKAWYGRNRKFMRAWMRDWMREARKSRPAYLVRFRLSGQIRRALDGQRRAKPTFDLLGYTPEQLRHHLERQFQAGMGWHNSAQWHIDHIVPLKAFKLDTPEDIRAAWALTNLRPIWATDNVRKGAARTHLL